MEQLRDEPGIERCLCSGYAHPTQTYECSKCGRPAECYGETSGYLCFACAREEFDGMDDEDAAELLGFEVL